VESFSTIISSDIMELTETPARISIVQGFQRFARLSNEYLQYLGAIV
jgi:hypothetical protein